MRHAERRRHALTFLSPCPQEKAHRHTAHDILMNWIQVTRQRARVSSTGGRGTVTRPSGLNINPLRGVASILLPPARGAPLWGAPAMRPYAPRLLQGKPQRWRGPRRDPHSMKDATVTCSRECSRRVAVSSGLTCSVSHAPFQRRGK